MRSTKIVYWDLLNVKESFVCEERRLSGLALRAYGKTIADIAVLCYTL